MGQPGVDFIGIGVGALIENNEGLLFLSCRGPEAKNERGLWEFPGGAVEFGETLEDALRRELLEEFNIDVVVIELLDIVDHILSGEKQHWVAVTFICHLLGGIPIIKESGKCSDIGWFRIDNIPSNLTRVAKVNLKSYLDKRTEKSKE